MILGGLDKGNIDGGGRLFSPVFLTQPPQRLQPLNLLVGSRRAANRHRDAANLETARCPVGLSEQERARSEIQMGAGLMKQLAQSVHSCFWRGAKILKWGARTRSGGRG